MIRSNRELDALFDSLPKKPTPEQARAIRVAEERLDEAERRFVRHLRMKRSRHMTAEEEDAMNGKLERLARELMECAAEVGRLMTIS